MVLYVWECIDIELFIVTQGYLINIAKADAIKREPPIRGKVPSQRFFCRLIDDLSDTDFFLLRFQQGLQLPLNH